MGSINKTDFGTFRARWRGADGKDHNKTFKKEADAKAHIKLVEGEIIKGDWYDPARGKTSLEDWIADCREVSFHLEDGTVEFEDRAAKEIIKELGHIQIRNIDEDVVAKFIAKQLKTVRRVAKNGNEITLSAASVAQQYRCLNKWLRMAVDKDRIRKNPCTNITPPESPPREQRFISMQELVALAEAINERYYAWVLLMGLVGLRYSEANGLRRKNIKLLDQKLDVVEQLVYIKGKFVRKTELKTKASKRSVTLDSPLLEIIGEHIDEFSPAGPTGSVFVNRNGSPLLPSSFTYNTFKPALRKVGIDPEFRIHDLRHTSVALAIAEGAHPKAIQRRLGHSSIKITFDLYGHLFPELDEELAARLGSSLRSALAGQEVIPFQRRRAA